MADQLKSEVNEKEKDKFLKSSIPKGDSEKEIKLTKRPGKIFATFFIVLNVFLMVALLGLVISWRELRKRSLEPHEQTVCFSCKEMAIDNEEMPAEFEGKIYKDGTNDGKDFVCCGYTSDVLNLLIAKFIKERHTSDRSILYSLVSEECKKTTQVKPSAQVNGIAASSFLNEHEGVVYWNISQSAILSDLITYKHGKLTVTRPGFYYIFSQLTYRHTPPTYSQSSDNNDTMSNYEHLPNHLDHFIYHISSKTGKHDKILEGSKSRCEMLSPNDEITSSLGAVFYLAADDEVYVKASHPDFIVPRNERNHFGLYMT